jgi:hypothetical protein
MRIERNRRAELHDDEDDGLIAISVGIIKLRWAM